MPDPRFLTHFTPPSALAGAGPSPAEMGFAAWSEAPSLLVAGAASPVAAGTLGLRRISLPGAMVITNVFLCLTTAGATLTANQCFVGVWDQGGNLIGLTGDQSAIWASAPGILQTPLTNTTGMPGPPCGVDTPYIYVGYWYNGTTAPLFARASSVDISMMNGAAGVSNANARCVTGNTGLTTVSTVPQQLQPVVKNVNANGAFWAAVA